MTAIANEFEPAFGDGVEAVEKRIRASLSTQQVDPKYGSEDLYDLVATASNPGVSAAFMLQWLTELHRLSEREELETQLDEAKQRKSDLNETISLYRSRVEQNMEKNPRMIALINKETRVSELCDEIEKSLAEHIQSQPIPLLPAGHRVQLLHRVHQA